MTPSVDNVSVKIETHGLRDNIPQCLTVNGSNVRKIGFIVVSRKAILSDDSVKLSLRFAHDLRIM